MTRQTRQTIRHWAWQAVVLGGCAVSGYIALAWLYSLDPNRADPAGDAAALIGAVIAFGLVIALPFALVAHFLTRRYGPKE